MSYYIDYKHAQWLKENGFNEWCPYVYNREGKASHCNGGGTNLTHSKDHCSAPDYKTVRRWLWEKNYFYVSLVPGLNSYWMWELYNLRTKGIAALDITPHGLWEAERIAVTNALKLMMGLDLPNPPFTSSQPIHYEVWRIQKLTEDLKKKTEDFLGWAKRNFTGEEWRTILEDLDTAKEFIRSAEELLEDVKNRSGNVKP